MTRPLFILMLAAGALTAPPLNAQAPAATRGTLYIVGGDQNRLAAVLRGTPTERAIRSRCAAGAVIGGTSADAAVMSAVMITGGERTPGGTRPDTTLDWVTIARRTSVRESTNRRRCSCGQTARGTCAARVSW
jgi:cyanophycinase-like exopeptidase